MAPARILTLSLSTLLFTILTSTAAASLFEAWPCKWKGFSLDGKAADVTVSCETPTGGVARCVLLDRENAPVAVGFLRFRGAAGAAPYVLGHLWNSTGKPLRARATLELRTRDHGTLEIVFEEADQERLLKQLR